MLAANFGFYANFKPQNNPTVEPKKWEPYEFGTQDGYEFYLKHKTIGKLIELAGKDSLFRDQVVNDTYNGYWKSRNISAHLKNVKPAVLTVGGWFDAEDPQGPLTTYREIAKHNPGTVNMLVMGPWAHGNWISRDGEKLGHVSFGFKTAEHYRKNILLPFFEKHLKDKADDKASGKPAMVHAFETGTNVWRQYPAWPPTEAKPRTLHFHAGGKLSWNAPASGAAYDEYVSDPDKPVPYINAITTGMAASYMTGDQRFAATRTDVLTYQTEVLEEDVTIAGPIVAKLFASSTGTDSDFVVKLIDVYPPEWPEAEASGARPSDVQPPKHQMAGYQQLVRGEPMRAKFRNSFEKPEPLTPGKVERVQFNMPDVHHTFRRGHRIMVQVQSSWFPLTDLNPQKFMRILEAKTEDFQKATQRVYRGSANASGVEVRVMGK